MGVQNAGVDGFVILWQNWNCIDDKIKTLHGTEAKLFEKTYSNGGKMQEKKTSQFRQIRTWKVAIHLKPHIPKFIS